MLGLHDLFHAFVVLQRFRERCRSRVNDTFEAETARIAIKTNRKVQRDSVDQKRGCDPGMCCSVVVARAGLLNRFHRVVSQPTDGIVQVHCFSCHCIHFEVTLIF